MKFLVIYLCLLVGTFVIDWMLDTPFLNEREVEGVCDEQLYQNHTGHHKCIYCFKSNSSQIAFRMDSEVN